MWDKAISKNKFVCIIIDKEQDSVIPIFHSLVLKIPQ